ncbi:MAG: hypothetical protein HY823_02130 [Acidobacteria bacterium]|nr:hypothetical protein [Acidobacteriota bacterium]
MDQKTFILQNIPGYNQGDHDGLCVYYSAAMLLVTLFPEMHTELGEGTRRRRVGFVTTDPLIAALAARRKEDPEKTLADWHWRGRSLKEVFRVLNRIAVERSGRKEYKALFQYFGRGTQWAANEKRLRDSIESGMPAMLGWQTRDLGGHCVLVYGFTDGSRGGTWFHTRDPSGGQDVFWATLEQVSRGSPELIVPDPLVWEDMRPDALCFFTKPGGKVEDRRLFRWWPDGSPERVQGWREVRALFEEARMPRTPPYSIR